MSTDVFCSAFSPSGDRFVCGTSAGNLHIVGAAETCSISVGAGRVYAMQFMSNEQVATGGDLGVSLWSLPTAAAAGNHKLPSLPLLTLALPDSLTQTRRCGRADVTETNALALSGAHVLFSGDGDGCAHAWDVRSRQPHSAVYRGHSGPIYCIDTCSPSLPSASSLPASSTLSAPVSNAASSSGDYLLATGGEDGCLCLFDVRNASAPLVVLHPTRDAPTHTTQSSSSLSRHSSLPASVPAAAGVSVPGAGAVPYVSCVKLSWPWLLVGGAHHFVSVYHAPSLEIAAALPQMGVPQALAMVDEKIVTCGSGGYLQSWTMHGVLEASVRCHSVASCWSLAVAPAASSVARHASDEDELDGLGDAAVGKVQNGSAKSSAASSTSDASSAGMPRAFATLARSAVVATGSSSSAAGKALCVDAFQHIKLPPTAVPL